MYYPLQRDRDIDRDREEKEEGGESERKTEQEDKKQNDWKKNQLLFSLSFLSVGTLSGCCLLPYTLRQDRYGQV